MESNVGIRELKANLSRHLKRVKSGATIRITERGRTIATIHPVSTTSQPDLSWLHQMVAEGHVKWGGGKPIGMNPPIKLRGRGKTASEMVIEDRR